VLCRHDTGTCTAYISQVAISAIGKLTILGRFLGVGNSIFFLVVGSSVVGDLVGSGGDLEAREAAAARAKGGGGGQLDGRDMDHDRWP
jgi:hypothetical protein